MLSRIAYYIIVLPLSYLPLRILYLKTDFLFLLLISIVPYRKKVIEGNLKRSFPEKSDKEIKRLRNKFYRHFTDLLAEGVKNLSISEKQLRRRFQVENMHIMEKLYEKRKNVILVSGHFNNWEWLVSGQGLLFNHKAYGIGMPLTSTFWDKKINERRSRFGMHVVHAKNYKEELEKNDDIKAVLVLSDQSPGNSMKSYWTNFLNQQTAVLFGAELMAHELDYAVVNFITHKVKRGYYKMELSLITENSKECNWGEITESHTRSLERAIIEKPEHWLWSHKRWKREIPENIESLKKQQEKRFNEKFSK